MTLLEIFRETNFSFLIFLENSILFSLFDYKSSYLIFLSHSILITESERATLETLKINSFTKRFQDFDGVTLSQSLGKIFWKIGFLDVDSQDFLSENSEEWRVV